ncbi:MAG: SMI1/KNR4 family protein [Candidatus Dormibacteria bacterium]
MQTDLPFRQHVAIMAIVDLASVLARVHERCLADGGPIHPRATPAEIEQAEARLGFALPEALRRLCLEVANGGVGPVPLYGVGNGRRSPEGDDLVGVYEGLLRPRPPYPERPGSRLQAVAVEAWPAAVLPLSEPRDGVLFCLDALGGTVLSGEGHAHELGIPAAEWLQREATSLEAWLVRWLDGESLPHRPEGPWGGR